MSMLEKKYYMCLEEFIFLDLSLIHGEISKIECGYATPFLEIFWHYLLIFMHPCVW